MATNFTKRVGDLAQTSVGGQTFTITGCTTATGSAIISTTGSLAGVADGQTVSGTGIPVGATVISIGVGTFTISANATASGTGTVTATGEMQVYGLSGWEITETLKTPEATTTDDAAWASSLPSTKEWSATVNYVYYDGDQSQRGALFGTINNPGVVTQWNFFVDAINSDDAWYGNAYVNSLKWGAKVGEIVKLDVTLKGTGPLTYGKQIAPVANTSTVTGLQAEV